MSPSKSGHIKNRTKFGAKTTYNSVLKLRRLDKNEYEISPFRHFAARRHVIVATKQNTITADACPVVVLRFLLEHKLYCNPTTIISRSVYNQETYYYTMISQTPRPMRQLNPFDSQPQTPLNPRAIMPLGNLLGNLENLSPPSLMLLTSNNNNPFSSISPRGRSSEFKDALKRMRSGSALARLKQERQRDVDHAKQEATERLRRLSSPAQERSSGKETKGASTPFVQLGRQAPERRNSGFARSA